MLKQVAIIQLKIFLTKKDSQADPGIFRRLLVPDHVNFYDLHTMIQISYGWCGVGGHKFTDFFDSEDIICDDFDFEDGVHGRVYHSLRYPVKGYLKHNALLYYTYFAEDDHCWDSILFVEDIEKRVEGVKYPLCLDGQKNTPPEDCGGWSGYEDLVMAMKDKNGELYKRYVDLYREPYDASFFNMNDVNDQLVNWRQFKRYWLSVTEHMQDL